VKHPSEVLKVGDEVNVYVLSVNPTEKKIALSIKRTQPEPWSRVASKYEIGQVVPATITQLANFGAFARIEDGIEGLVHVSELSEERVNHPREVVQEGQEVTVRIIRIDAQRRRMGLSLRRVNESDTPLAGFGESQPEGGATEGTTQTAQATPAETPTEESAAPMETTSFGEAFAEAEATASAAEKATESE
jgi:small subunit ribosomal protein S1